MMERLTFSLRLECGKSKNYWKNWLYFILPRSDFLHLDWGFGGKPCFDVLRNIKDGKSRFILRMYIMCAQLLLVSFYRTFV